MSHLTSTTRLSEVTVIQRRGVGPVYRATMSIEDLYTAMRRSVIRYSPRYQRGFANWAEASEDDLNVLLPISDENLQISPARAQMMAVKYLHGRLFSSHITWNARKEPDLPEPDFDDEQHELVIETTITVPDTAHRHRAYYLLVHWKRHPDEIPDTVDVDGETVAREEIVELLEDFDPASEYVHCDVYVLNAESEGYLYDEFNADAKAPPTSVAISLNPKKTPSRRFMTRLMEKSALFSPSEIETRGNTIGSKSRKLTTNATIEAATRNMCKPPELAALEKNSAAYEDLVDFMGAFFEEWAHHFPAFLPDKSAEERNRLRSDTFALSNVMFHPLFKLAYDLWKNHYENDEDWRLETDWQDAIARLGGMITTTNPDDHSEITVPVMSRENPDWRGKILVPRFDADGTRTGFIVSSTRQTREAAYAYLRQQARLGGGTQVTEPAAA